MCRLLAALPLVVLAGCGYGFDPGRAAPAPGQRNVDPLLAHKATKKKGDGSPEQEAVVAALEAVKGKSKELFDGLKADAQPSAVRRLAADLAAVMKGLDLGAAPSEFKAVWNRHRKAWLGLQAAVARLPDAYEDTEFTDALTGLFKSDPSRGKSLGGDMVEAVRAVTKSHAELYTAAEAVGLEIEK